MTKEETAIGPWLLTPLLIVAAFGQGGLLNNPHFAAKILGNNGYWSIPIATIFITPAIAAIYFLTKRFPDQNLIEQGKSILGGFIGTITGFVYLVSLSLFLAMMTRDIVNLVSMYFLFTTPIYELAVIYVLSVVWLASRGIETITRTASIIVIPALSIFLFFLVASAWNIHLNNLKPVFTPLSFDYLKAGKTAMNIFFMLGVVAMVLPFLKPLHKFPRFVFGILLFLLVLFGLIAVSHIGVYGSKFLTRFAFPGLAAYRIIRINFLSLEQVGMIVGIAMIVTCFLGSSFGHFALSLGLSQIAPFWDYKVWAWVLVPFTLCIILWPPGILQTKVFVGYIAANGWIPFFAYPFVLWLIAVVFKRKGATKVER